MAVVAFDFIGNEIAINGMYEFDELEGVFELLKEFKNEFMHGTVLDEVVVEYPVGHKRRREEGIPLLKEKYQRNLARIFDASQKTKIEELTLDYEKLSAARVDAVMDLFVKK